MRIKPLKKVELLVKHISSRVLANFKTWPTPLTDKRELAQLIQRLWPVSPGIELIRLGPDSDGGYLVPDDLEGIEACFSPGVCDVAGFEHDCVKRGMAAFLADGSVAGPPVSDPRIHFTKKFIGAADAGDFMTLDQWVATSLPDSASDLLLQIDIEGFEYETFLSVSDQLLRRFRIIVVEFHELRHLWSRPYFSLISSAFKKLLIHHSCVHIHPNNGFRSTSLSGLEIPHLMEFTFLRNDRFSGRTAASSFPHPLDVKNDASKPTKKLPETWYRALK